MTRSHSRLTPWLVLAAAVAAHLALLVVRHSASVVSGDEGTFLAMAESLALDGDLVFDEADLERIEAATRPGRRGVILQTTDRIAYSKPALYPLLAAPWYRLGRELGMVLFNVSALALALLLAYRYLRRVDPRPGRAAWTLVTFAGTGVLLSYTVWTMSDSLQASMTLAGLVLCLAALRATPDGAGDRLERLLDSRWAPLAGAVLLGAVVAMRYPNGLIAVAPLVALALSGRPRRALIAALGLAASLALGVGVNQWLGGAPVPYKTLRATFNPASGYPAGPQAVEVVGHWRAAEATQRLGVTPVEWEPVVSAYGALYFVIGRHTGLLVYFPAALVLAAAAFRRRDRVGWTVLLAVLAMAAFYLGWMPRNFFGGATFIGNRYFIAGYAALLVAPGVLPGRRSLAAVWAVSLLALASALVSAARNPGLEEPSQSHAYAGVFRWLPYESIAPALDGRRDRYWSDELVRFVDPYARVERHGFRLEVARAAAETLIASGREHRWIRFLVQADRPGVEFVYRDWRRSQVTTLEDDGAGGSWGLVAVEASPPWRRHPYWWDPATTLGAWSTRLSLRGPEGASAEVRFLGPYRLVPKFYAAEAVAAVLPPTGVAGERLELPVVVRNTGWRPWATEDSIPIHLGYRLTRAGAPADAPRRAGPLTRIERVGPGAELAVPLKVRWPERPGRYRVVVDLVVAGRLWFESWDGGPVAVGEIDVLPASGPGAAAVARDDPEPAASEGSPW